MRLCSGGVQFFTAWVSGIGDGPHRQWLNVMMPFISYVITHIHPIPMKSNYKSRIFTQILIEPSNGSLAQHAPSQSVQKRLRYRNAELYGAALKSSERHARAWVACSCWRAMRLRLYCKRRGTRGCGNPSTRLHLAAQRTPTTQLYIRLPSWKRYRYR